MRSKTVADLSNAVRRLGLDEIRALGTHEDFAKTVDDIEREFRYMLPHLATIEQCIPTEQSFAKPASEVLEFADEACRKSEGNRKAYEFSREAVLAEFTHLPLRDAFLARHKTGKEIWDSDAVQDLARRAKTAYLNAAYLDQIAKWSDSSVNRNPVRGFDLVATAEKLNRIHNLRLPTNPDEIFAGKSSKIVPSIRRIILAVVAALKEA